MQFDLFLLLCYYFLIEIAVTCRRWWILSVSLSLFSLYAVCRMPFTGHTRIFHKSSSLFAHTWFAPVRLIPFVIYFFFFSSFNCNYIVSTMMCNTWFNSTFVCLLCRCRPRASLCMCVCLSTKHAEEKQSHLSVHRVHNNSLFIISFKCLFVSCWVVIFYFFCVCVFFFKFRFTSLCLLHTIISSNTWAQATISR